MLAAECAGAFVGYLYGDVTPAMGTSSTYAFQRFHIHHIGVTAPAGSAGVALIVAASRRRGSVVSRGAKADAGDLGLQPDQARIVL